MTAILASFIHILVPYITKQKMVHITAKRCRQGSCVELFAPSANSVEDFDDELVLVNFGPRGLASCAMPLPLGWRTGLAASAAVLLHLAFDSKQKLLSLSMDLMILKKIT